MKKAATMMKYNISTNLIQVIKNLFNKVTSVVLFDSSLGDWFRTTVGVRQGCLLSPTLFKIFLERIMTDALEDHVCTASTGGITIINLRSLVTSIFLYTCELWTLTSELQRRIQAMEMRCYR